MTVRWPPPRSSPASARPPSMRGSRRAAAWRGALTHCVVHQLDITEAVPLARRVPDDCITQVLDIVAAPDAPNLFGVDLAGVTLRASDLDWSVGSGALVSGPAQALALVACGRRLPAGRLEGEAAARFSRRLTDSAALPEARRRLPAARCASPARPEILRPGRRPRVNPSCSERRGSQARGVPLRAHDDDLLVVAVDLGQGVVAAGIEPPLEHVALDHQPRNRIRLPPARWRSGRMSITRAPAAWRSSSCEGSTLSISARAPANNSSTVCGVTGGPAPGSRIWRRGRRAGRWDPLGLAQHRPAHVRATSRSAVTSYLVMNVNAGL